MTVRFLQFPSRDNDLAPIGWQGQHVPEHTQEALEHYLLLGWNPGGFLHSVLTNNLYRAITSADIENRKMLWCITTWIMNEAPAGSWGSEEAVQRWILDQDQCRTRFKERIERDYVWKTLKEGDYGL